MLNYKSYHCLPCENIKTLNAWHSLEHLQAFAYLYPRSGGAFRRAHRCSCLGADDPRDQLREVLRHLRASTSRLRLHKDQGDTHLRLGLVLRRSVHEVRALLRRSLMPPS